MIFWLNKILALGILIFIRKLCTVRNIAAQWQYFLRVKNRAARALGREIFSSLGLSIRFFTRTLGNASSREMSAL